MRRRGYAMIVALLVITLLIGGGALLVQELMVRSKELRDETTDLHLQNVLDSAVAYMMAKYRYELDFEGTENFEIDGGEAEISAEAVTLHQRRVVIAAEYHGKKRSVEIQLFVASSEPIKMTDWKPVVSSLPYR